MVRNFPYIYNVDVVQCVLLSREFRSLLIVAEVLSLSIEVYIWSAQSLPVEVTVTLIYEDMNYMY